MSDNYQQRFGGIARLYGESEAEQLRELHVCVIGLGGVGSWAVEALARTGIEKITLIDFDTVSASNSNRQLPAMQSTLGMKKHAVMAARVADINPDCQCHVIDDFITEKNMADYLDRGYDYVIDAIDSISFKAAIIYYCRRNKIPIITTGGAGGLIDPTQVSYRDLTRTCNDALAAKVRACLRQRHGYTRNPQRYFGVECVYSTEQPRYPAGEGKVSFAKPGIHGVSMDCNFAYGSSSVVTSVFGFVAVSRVIEKSLRRLAKQK